MNKEVEEIKIKLNLVDMALNEILECEDKDLEEFFCNCKKL
jgi:hypothetical protein